MANTLIISGISRIEVAIGLLIAICLAALLFPAVMNARESARRRECENTMKQLAFTLRCYHDAQQSFPQGCIGNPELPPEKRWSWYTAIGNYWGHYGTPAIDHDRPWDDPALRPLQLHTWSNGGPEGFEEFDIPLAPPPITNCPNGTPQTHTDGQPFTDYVGPAGIGVGAATEPRNSPRAGLWSYDETRTQFDIRDGESHTLIALETSRDNGCWLAGGPATVRHFNPREPSIGAGGQFGGLHPGGCVAVFVDGHVQFLAKDISPEVLSAAVTIAGDREVDE